MLKMIKPKVCVMNIENDEKEEDIVNKIKKQNPDLSQGDLSSKNRNRWRNLNAVIEVDSESLHIMLNSEYIKVGWVKCMVREYYDLRRCFNCQGYNHKANACKNKAACIKCGGEHGIKECVSSENKCINCTKYNTSLGMDSNCEHNANDKCCPVFLRKLKVLKEKIQY